MVTSLSFTVAIVSILCFISTAYGGCGAKDLVIGTTRSGRQIEGKPEWNVQVVNNCNCSLSNIVLSCKGFQTVEAIDPSIFKKINGDLCIVNGGRPLRPRVDVRFSYAWDPPFFLFPFSTKSSC